MNTTAVTTSKFLAASMLALFFSFGFAVTRAEAAAVDSSIYLKKDPGGSLFTLTIRDPDGIQEFSLALVGRYSYGGGLNNCPKSFSSANISLIDPGDFTPVMSAYVIDCKNNKTELEIAPPVDGATRSQVGKKEESSPPPLPPPPPARAEKKEGPLSAEDVEYPVRDLGGCQNEIECRSYCDNTSRARECLAFAQKYHLISAAEAEEAADKFLNVRNGPGGCSDWSSCEAYCSTVSHLDECIAFADETGYYSPEELAEARKFQALVKAGKQFPGGCTDRNACEIYCGDPMHMEECLNFAEESGFMESEEIAEARKFMALMREGESPGGCTSKEQCEKYCFEDGHVDECIAFAEKAGVMSAEEAEMARKVGGLGPGGCRSKQQCETYCQDNSEECFRFAQEHGLISEDDLKEMREGMAHFREELDKMPPEAVQCMRGAAGEENFDRMLAGEPVFDRAIEGKMKSCFGEVTAQLGQQLSKLPPEAATCVRDAVGDEGLQKLAGGEFDHDLNFEALEGCFEQLQASFGGGGNFSSGGFSGPGGCATTEACIEYCNQNPEECKDFGPPEGGFEGGPGGCKSPDECSAYCKEHPDECGGGSGFLPGSGAGFSGPGGCTTLEECAAYCQSDPQDEACQAYVGGGGGSGAQGCIEPPRGLVGWWSADVARETTVPDITMRSNGAIVGGVTIVPMEIGSAFQFDGSSGHIDMGNPPHLNFGTGPFSLEAWFQWNGGGSSDALNIIRKSNYPVSGPGAGYWLRIGRDSQTLEFSVGATTGPDGQSIITAPVGAGAWHHAVGTKDSSGNLKLYVDGESVGTLLRQAPSADTTSEAPFTLGAWDDRFGITELFPGLIDEVSAYNGALSAREVRDLFESGSIGKCSAGYGHPNREAPQGVSSFSGPGGCTSVEACTTYCMAHYADPSCASFGAGTLEPPETTPAGSTAAPSSDQSLVPQGHSSWEEFCKVEPGDSRCAAYTTPLSLSVDCSLFGSVSSCSYVGPPDSQNYSYCKQCYPDR